MELRGHSTVLNHAKMPCWILSSSCWKSRWHTECTAKLLGLSLQSTSRQWRGQAARSRCDISLFEHHVNYSLLSCRAQGMSASLRSAKFFFFPVCFTMVVFLQCCCLHGRKHVDVRRKINIIWKKTGSTTDLNLELPDVISEQRMQESNASGVESSLSH